MKKENLLSAKDICSIVKACKSAGVVSLQFQGLSVSFQKDLDPSKAIEDGHEEFQELFQTISPTPYTSLDPKPESEQIDLDLLRVEDPVEWERRELEELNG